MKLNDRKYKEFKLELKTDTWKSFITERLFSKFENGKTNQQMLTDGDDCFYVGAKRDDNGIMLHCAKDETLLTKGNCIVFICNGQGSVGYANYMDVDFMGTTDIVAGYNDNLNQYTGLFLATIYSLERPKYSFGRKWKTHLATTIVSLPVKHNSDGSVFIDKTHKYSDEGYVPDWEFMENYIKSLHHKPLTTKNKPKHTFELNVSEWKTFHVQRTKQQSGLFEIENCKCGSAGELEDGNDINYIGAKKSYNGVMRSVTIDKNLVSRGRGIMFICDGEGSVGYTNYMNEDFIGSTTTSIGYDEALTEKNAMFLVTVLDNEKFKYSYGRKYRAHLIDAVINLPIKHNSDGSVFIDKTYKYSDEGYVPDWEFMENYIKSLPYGDRLNG